MLEDNAVPAAQVPVVPAAQVPVAPTAPEHDNFIITPITMNGLARWYKYMFEKLGWMILGKHYGKHLKIKGYLHSINELIKHAEKKLVDTEENDRKNDIQIIINNSYKLRKFAEILFNKMVRGMVAINKMGEAYNAIATDVTMRGLEKWHVVMFEKFGWMLLAKTEGKLHKVDSYMNSIDDLIASLNLKLGKVNENDRKYDLNVILTNVKILQDSAKYLFSKI